MPPLAAETVDLRFAHFGKVTLVVEQNNRRIQARQASSVRGL